MRKQGRIVRWQDRRGYGFIAPAAGGADVFVHINGFPRGTRRPAIGSEVSYLEVRDFDGRARAESVELRRRRLWPALAMPASVAPLAAVLFLLLVAGIVTLEILPRPVLWLYVGMSVLTFAYYARDKRAAEQGGWRTDENTLHLLALLGGWPGAVFAHHWLRHKSVKTSFRAVFALTLLLNIAGLVYVVSDYGTWLVDWLTRLVG